MVNLYLDSIFSPFDVNIFFERSGGIMKLNKKLLGALSLMMATSANAKTYFDESTNRALVYYNQGESVNASVCEQVTEDNLRTSLQAILKLSNCTQLSPVGITQQDIEEKLPELKKQMLSAVGSLDNMMSGFSNIIEKDNKLDDQNMFSSMMSSFFQQQRKSIEGLTADQVFQQYQIDARIPTLEKVKKSKDLDSEIEQFVLLTKK